MQYLAIGLEFNEITCCQTGPNAGHILLRDWIHSDQLSALGGLARSNQTKCLETGEHGSLTIFDKRSFEGWVPKKRFLQGRRFPITGRMDLDLSRVGAGNVIDQVFKDSSSQTAGRDR